MPPWHERCFSDSHYLYTLRPRQNGHLFADDIFKCIFFNENVWISIKISLRIQLTIFQHWFRKRLDADQATSHYLNQWCLVDCRIYTSLGLNEVTNADLLLIRPLVSHFGEIWTQIQFLFRTWYAFVKFVHKSSTIWFWSQLFCNEVQ